MNRNTERPTKEEVGDYDPCWVFNNRPLSKIDSEWPPMWVAVFGLVARRDWEEEYTHWLPYSSIVNPNDDVPGEFK